MFSFYFSFRTSNANHMFNNCLIVLLNIQSAVWSNILHCPDEHCSPLRFINILAKLVENCKYFYIIFSQIPKFIYFSIKYFYIVHYTPPRKKSSKLQHFSKNFFLAFLRVAECFKAVKKAGTFVPAFLFFIYFYCSSEFSVTVSLSFESFSC